IATAKAELVAALPATGLAVLNGDDERVRAMAGQTPAEVLLVGEESRWDGTGRDAARATVRAEQVRLDERGRPSFRLVTPDGSAPVTLAVSGRHQVGNALLAAAVAYRQGLSVADLAAALAQCRP